MGQDKVEVVNFIEHLDVLDGTEFDAKVREYRKWHEQETQAKAAKKRLGPEIEALLLIVDEKSLGVDDLVAVQCNGRAASYISAEALAMAGVDADTIKACTIPGKSYTYVQVRKIGEKEE